MKHNNQASWGKRYKEQDLSHNEEHEFSMNKFHIGVVTNITYEFYNGEMINMASDKAPGFVMTPFCNDTNYEDIENFYSEYCLNYSQNYLNDDLHDSRMATKILFEQDRVLDIDLINASYDLLLYNYAKEQYVILRI